MSLAFPARAAESGTCCRRRAQFYRDPPCGRPRTQSLVPGPCQRAVRRQPDGGSWPSFKFSARRTRCGASNVNPRPWPATASPGGDLRPDHESSGCSQRWFSEPPFQSVRHAATSESGPSAAALRPEGGEPLAQHRKHRPAALERQSLWLAEPAGGSSVRSLLLNGAGRQSRYSVLRLAHAAVTGR